MDVCAFRFSISDLQKIDREHLGFLIASSHFCNEVVCLAPYIIFEHDSTNANEAEKAIVTVRYMTVLRQIASKIVEYNKLVQKYLATIRKTHPAEAARVHKLYAPISKRINAASWARELRNKVSFHFDAEHALERFSSVDPDRPVNFMAGELKGVTYYNFAEEIISYPFFEEIGDGDAFEGAEKVNEFCFDLHSKIPDFHAELVIHHFREAGLLDNQDRLELRASYCAKVGSMRIPIAVSDSA